MGQFVEINLILVRDFRRITNPMSSRYVFDVVVSVLLELAVRARKRSSTEIRLNNSDGLQVVSGRALGVSSVQARAYRTIYTAS
jgi:hypothetical protein